MFAPALAATSTSARPASMIFMSATMVAEGKSLRSSRIDCSPSLLMSGVPASSQSTPPAIASFAFFRARCKSTKSRASCKIGFILSPSFDHRMSRGNAAHVDRVLVEDLDNSLQ